MIAAWLVGGALCVASGGDDGAKPPGPDLAAYQAAQAAAGRDAESQVDLALWCEARGMAAERTRHLTRAILIDPENARARGLLGFVKQDGKWVHSQQVPKALEDSPEAQALMQEYLRRRAKAADKADDQYELALWCEKNGLPQAMVAHLHRTLQLDPGRDGAWKRLGFKKSGKRWVNPEVEAALKAEREAQAKADKAWKPRLEKMRDELTDKVPAKREAALAGLAAVDDPRAVPMLLLTFSRADEGRQRVAVDVLSRIEGPIASLALATFAVFSPHPAIRSDAATLLQRRDPREYAGMLASMIRDEVKYKVKPIDGPGGQGELLVEGPDANTRRLYTPLQNPAFMPGDQVGRDANGNVVVNRPVGPAYYGPEMSPQAWIALNSGRPVVGVSDPFGWSTFWSPPDNLGAAAGTLEKAGVPASLAQTAVGRMAESNSVYTSALSLAATLLANPTGTGIGGGIAFVRPVLQDSLQLPMQQMINEARASAMVAQQQLAGDVASIEAYNKPIREVNERSIAILKAVSGRDLGNDRKEWANWVMDLQGYARPFKAASQPPATVVEQVPLDFQAQSVGLPATNVLGAQIFRHSCFAAGTAVRTQRGDTPIEKVEPGDLVLSQDVATGRLEYRPVLEAVHNPPDRLLKVTLAGGEVVRATGIHRLWKAGEGWAMVRDLKAGDRLRAVGGSAEVVSVEADAVEPVFNLVLAGGDDYCVGALGVLAHDNSLVEAVAAPFDAVSPGLASASARP